MQHTCQDCGHQFFNAGQSQDSITPAAQCPSCHSYKTQPSGIPDESSDMLHGMQAMPTSTQDDMSGNPLQEGVLADGGWKNRAVRDESFAASTKRSDFPTLFDAMEPEFETTQIVAPPDLYRHGMETEAAHKATLQIPHGITDNLHAALGNLGAWVENPYDNGQLRPYYNKYWKVIRPSYMNPGSLRIGVAEPTMAEIINHVAQTDDLTPLQEYRGKESHTKTAGPVAAFFAPMLEAIGIGGGAAAGGAAAGAGAEAAGAGATEAASSAAGAGGLMNKAMGGGAWELGKKTMGGGLGMADDALGMGGGGGAPSAPGVQDPSFYSRNSSDEDDAHPSVHDEIPKQEDGDYKQKDDGNSHEWQRDISVNDIGGTEHAPSFNPDGPAFQRFVMMAPLLLQYLHSGEDASQDPLVQALHQSLDAEIPGYRDHGDDAAADRLILMLSPKQGEPESSHAEPEKNEETHTDENSGGKHESKVASLNGEAAEFLPDFEVTPPALRGFGKRSASPHDIATGVIPGAMSPEEEVLDSSSWPQSRGPEHCPYCGHYGPVGLGLCAGCGREIYPHGQGQQQALEYSAKLADTQGPHTPEQIQAVQQWLLEHGGEMGLEGEELIQTILSVPTNPLEFADVLAKIQQSEPPPPGPEDAGMSSNPPMPAQENAPPGATMPVPGMEQQMMGAVSRYAADSVADVCPECGSHTTALLDEDGSSQCHACDATFTTKGKKPNKIDSKEALAGGEGFGESSGDMGSEHSPVQGVPIADQQHQRDLREEQDSGHTWTAQDGAPLKVGEEYEMYSSRYDIPDLIRIDSVKPNAIQYTLTGEFGLEHSTELTREEANVEHISFSSTHSDGEMGADDSLEENNDDNTGYTGAPEHRDMSAPSGLVASVVQSGVGEQDNQKLEWLMEGVKRTAGANYTPMEQRALIDERGEARNSGLLALQGTHYITDEGDGNEQFLFGL